MYVYITKLRCATILTKIVSKPKKKKTRKEELHNRHVAGLLTCACVLQRSSVNMILMVTGKFQLVYKKFTN